MPSPFPGMDPYIESQEWDDFHHSAMVTAAELLQERLGDGFVARRERRPPRSRSWPRLLPWSRRHLVPRGPVLCFKGTASSVTSDADRDCSGHTSLEIDGDRQRIRVTLRNARSRKVLTIIEMLAPEDKRSGSTARQTYLRERDRILRSRMGFVELDLLRGGEKMPLLITNPPKRGYDYSALQSRGWIKGHSAVIAWPLRDRMPAIPVPLRGEPDVPLDLQAVLDAVYDRADYGGTLKYSAPLVPHADAPTQKWIDELLTSKGIAAPAAPPSQSPAAEPDK